MVSNRGFFIARNKEGVSHGEPIGNPADRSISVWQTLDDAQAVLTIIKESGIEDLYIFYFDITALGRVIA
jgi:hypothetical protein